MLILLAGLPGSGKSTLARKLAALTHGVVLNKDEIRAALFPGDTIEYMTEQDDFVMKIMLETAAYLLERRPDRMVFLDGRPFAKAYQIEQVIDAASAMKQPWRMLLCVCSEQTARDRLQQATTHIAGNRDFGLYQRIKSEFEPITVPHIVIDTEQPEECSISRAMAALSTGSV
jgi:predicted kinase